MICFANKAYKRSFKMQTKFKIDVLVAASPVSPNHRKKSLKISKGIKCFKYNFN